MAKIRSFNLDDTPSVRGFLFCSANNKNIYKTGEGFIPERFQYSLTDTVKMDCKIELIRECDNKFEAMKPEDIRYFNVLKCVAENREDNCKKIS